MSHALFPAEDETDPPAVGFVMVARVGGDGKRVFSPRLWPAAELPDLEALAGAYGGGTFEVVARSADKARIVARRVYTLPGRPRPMTGEDDADERPAAPVAVAGAPGDLPSLLMLLDERARQRDDERERRERESRRAILETVMALGPMLQPLLAGLFSQRDGTAALLERLLPMLMAQGKESASAPVEAFMAGMSTAAEMAGSLAGGGGDGDPLSTFARVFAEKVMAEKPKAPPAEPATPSNGAGVS